MVITHSYSEGAPIPINELPAYKGSLSKFHTIGYAEVTDEETGETTLQTSKVSLDPLEKFMADMRQFADDMRQAVSEVTTDAAVRKSITLYGSDFETVSETTEETTTNENTGEEETTEVTTQHIQAMLTAPTDLQNGFIGGLFLNGKRQLLNTGDKVSSMDNSMPKTNRHLDWRLEPVVEAFDEEENEPDENSGEEPVEEGGETTSDETEASGDDLATYTLIPPDGVELTENDMVELQFLAFENDTRIYIPLQINNLGGGQCCKCYPEHSTIKGIGEAVIGVSNIIG